MAEIPIKIHILEREYTIKAAQRDVDAVRKAAAQLNESVQHLKQHFRITDKQDLLAMVAFDSVFQQFLVAEEFTDCQKKVEYMDQIVDKALSLPDSSKTHLPEIS